MKKKKETEINLEPVPMKPGDMNPPEDTVRELIEDAAYMDGMEMHRIIKENNKAKERKRK